MFWKQIFFVRIMKYQVEFWHLLSWRLLRPAYVNFLKTGGWNSNVQISWSHWAPQFNKNFDLSIPQSHLVSSISIWYTLYHVFHGNISISCKNDIALATNSILHYPKNLEILYIVAILQCIVKSWFNFTQNLTNAALCIGASKKNCILHPVSHHFS